MRDSTSPAGHEIDFTVIPHWPRQRRDGPTYAILTRLLGGEELTVAEISGEIDLCYDLVKRVCGTFSKEGKQTPKLLRIVRYVFEVLDGRRYPRPVYKFARGKNCKKPAVDNSANSRRYRDSKVTLSTTSVFDLALNQKDRIRGIRVSLIDRNTNASDPS